MPAFKGLKLRPAPFRLSDWEGGIMSGRDVEGLFQEHAESVFGAVYRVTLDRAAAEDATQEAFVRLITRPPREDSNLGAWLRRVAVNFAIDNLRRNSRQQPLGDHDVPDRPGHVPRDTALSDGLLRALSRLKPDHRAAVLAVDRDGMSYQDASELLGVHLNKLKTDLLRGRRALHDLLKD
jgi:RNA polymerase sigma-70 factor, ECF subfamily